MARGSAGLKGSGVVLKNLPPPGNKTAGETDTTRAGHAELERLPGGFVYHVLNEGRGLFEGLRIGRGPVCGSRVGRRIKADEFLRTTRDPDKNIQYQQDNRREHREEGIVDSNSRNDCKDHK